MSQTPASPLQDEELKGQLETLLFITDHPLTLEDLRKLTKVRDTVRLGALVGEIRQKLEDQKSALQVLEVAGGFQMATRPAHGDLVRKLFADRMTLRLSTAAHETLAIIAYKQPLTRAEIEDIRGVEVIAALESLLEKHLIKVVGRKESVGRPLLYGTTADFMRHFGLRNLEDLPPIEQFHPADAPAHAPEGPFGNVTEETAPDGQDNPLGPSGTASGEAAAQEPPSPEGGPAPLPEGAAPEGGTNAPEPTGTASEAQSPGSADAAEPPQPAPTTEPADPVWPGGDEPAAPDEAPSPEQAPDR